jgi:elongation factor 2
MPERALEVVFMVRKEYVVEEVQKMMNNLQNVRNVAICAHVDHGKTTMTDSLVARAGLISKETAGEQRIMDFDEQEQARGITIKAANISLAFQMNGQDWLVNLIDTPGHVDFGGHVTRAMRAVDGVVLVVDSVEGVMPQTETVLRQALKEKARPVVFINKIDRLINELQLNDEQMQQRLLKILMQVNKLIEEYAPKEFKDEWHIDVKKGNIAFGSAYYKWAVSIKAMQKFNIKFSDIFNYCRKGDHKTLQEKAPLDEVLLEMIIEHLPNPVVAQKYRIPQIWHGDLDSEDGKALISCSPDAKTIGVCIGVVNDPHAGEVAIVRLFSGKVKKGDMLYMAARMTSEKVQQVAIYMGPDRVTVDNVIAGNIVGIVGLRDIFVGETVSSGEVVPFEQIKHYSEPVITKSIEAKDSKDLAKLINILRALSKEDPTLKVELNQETGEHLISGMGELHLEIIIYKIEKEKGVPVITSPPIVVYREIVTGKCDMVEGKSPNRHTKIKFSVEPVEQSVMDAMLEGKIPDGRPKGKQIIEALAQAGLPRDEAKGVVDIYNRSLLINETRGVQYLNEIMELVIQGFEEALNSGPLCKEKVFGIKVKILDATIHEDPVHRGPAQIIPATKRPIYAGMLMAGVQLQEPKQKITILVPAQYISPVITLINGRRGQMLDIQQEGESATLVAKVAVAEMFGFANDLRSATQGRAIWYQEYAGYEPLPRELLAKTVKAIRERKGEKPDPPTPADFLD